MKSCKKQPLTTRNVNESKNESRDALSLRNGHTGRSQQVRSTWIPDKFCRILGSLSLLEARRTDRRAAARSQGRIERTVAGYVAKQRDQKQVAILSAGCIARYISFCILAQAIHLTRAASQPTVNNECPSACLCIYGKDNLQRIPDLMKKERVIGAWSRLQSDSHAKVSKTYFCGSSSLTTVPPKLTSIAEALFLDNNSITTLRSSDLAPRPNDVTSTSPTLALSLSGNQLIWIEENTFRLLRNLKLLVLRNNSLHDLQWTVSESPFLQNLTELDLSLNDINHLRSTDFAKFPSLERLDMSGNEIQSVDGNVLLNFPKLEHLDLSSNRITPQGLSPCNVLLPTMRLFSMADNLLRELHFQTAQFLRKFSGLETLDVSGNVIDSEEVPSETFSSLTSLRTLNMSRCGIRNLRQGWLNGGPHQSLRILDLSYNFLSTISSYALSSVFTIDHTSSSTDTFNNLAQVPKGKVETHWLRPLRQLEVLYLNDNRHLTRIEDNTFDFLPNLRLLFLQNCAIRRLNIASASRRYGYQPIATTLPELTNLWIHGNPLACDCYVRFLKEWSVTRVTVHQNETTSKRFIDAPSYNIDSGTKNVGVELAKCVYPQSMAGATVVGTPSRGMTCQEEPRSILIAMLIGPLTFAGSIALTVLCGSFHVCFTKMKKGSVLSYQAREDLMRNPKIRMRRRNAPPRIFDGFAWGSSAPQDSRLSTPGRSRHTNLILGQLGSRGEEHHNPHHGEHRLSPAMALARSTANLTIDDPRSHSRNSAGYCSGTDNPRTDHYRLAAPLVIISDTSSDDRYRTKGGSGSDVDSVLERESVRTRSASSEIPFIDEKSHPDESLRRSSSSSSSESNFLSSGNHLRTVGSNNKSESDLRRRKDNSVALSDRHQNERSIPGLSARSNSTSEDTRL